MALTRFSYTLMRDFCDSTNSERLLFSCVHDTALSSRLKDSAMADAYCYDKAYGSHRAVELGPRSEIGPPRSGMQAKKET